MTRTTAIARFRREGWHYWNGASEKRFYLGQLHRHLFHIEVELELLHDDREVEFHDLLDFCKEHFPDNKNHNGRSCETMAKELRAAVVAQYPNRWCAVSVFEDGEVGARVTPTTEASNV